jgi:tetratricopeptide (TPR) repeat protein
LADAIASPLTAPVPRRRDWKGFLLRAAVIFLVALFVYIPAMQSKWIWDDNLLITQYRVMQDEHGLRIFWLSSLAVKWLPQIEKYTPWILRECPWLKDDAELADTVPDYYPITWTSLWLEWRLWKDKPAAYHVTNCVMHAISAVLVWRVLTALSVPGAFLAGLVFAVHPVNVCSVAWVSERKNTLSIIFFLLTLLFYFHYEKTRHKRWYFPALVMLLAAMLSKASVVPLPVVLLLAAWWRRGRGQVSPQGWVDRFVAACLRVLGWIVLPVVMLLAAWWWLKPGQVWPWGWVQPLGVACAAGLAWLVAMRLLPLCRRVLGTVPPLRWIGQRLFGGGWRNLLADLVRTAPFFLVAGAAAWLVVDFQIHRVIRGEKIFFNPPEATMWWRLVLAGAVPWSYVSKAQFLVEGTMWWRLAMAGAVPWFYIYKALLPLNLLMIYPRWRIRANLITTMPTWQVHWSAIPWLLPGVALVAVAVVLVCLRRRGWARHLIFAGGYFLVLLFPTMGFFNMYFFVHSLVADHWQHLSIIGLIALVVGAGTWAFRLQGKKLRWAGVAVGTAVVGVLGVLTWHQTLYYDDQITLWRYNLPKNPEAWMGQYNLGTTLAEQAVDEPDPAKRKALLEEALAHLVAATKLKPDDDPAQNNAGLTLMNLGRVDEALPYLRRAVERALEHANTQAAMNLSLVYRSRGSFDEALKYAKEAVAAIPSPGACISYAETLAMAGRPQEAIGALTDALKVAPAHVELWFRRGLYYKALGQVDQALLDFQHALRLQNNAAPVLFQVGLIAEERGQRDEALKLFTQVILLSPGNVEARYHLGLQLLGVGRNLEAAAQLTMVVQTNPSNAEAHGNLALAWLRSGRIPQAIAEYRQTLKLQPGWVQAQCDLARLLAHPLSGSERNIPEAIKLAEESCQATKYQHPAAVQSLAMVYSEAGRFDEAVKLQERALTLVAGKADDRALAIMKGRLDLYKSHKPFSAVEPVP